MFVFAPNRVLQFYWHLVECRNVCVWLFCTVMVFNGVTYLDHPPLPDHPPHLQCTTDMYNLANAIPVCCVAAVCFNGFWCVVLARGLFLMQSLT